MLPHLRRLALRVEALIAHVTVAAGDAEGHYHAVAGLDLLDLAPHFLDDPHRLVAEDVALAHERPHHFVQVKVGPADP
jgi:hypothetical protein